MSGDLFLEDCKQQGCDNSSVLYLSQSMTKQEKLPVHPVKASTQTDQSLRGVLNGKLRTHGFLMQTAKTDQTGRMPRLIWGFAGHTGHFVMLWLIY